MHMALRDGRLQLVVGGLSSSVVVTAFQLLVNSIDYELPVDDAVTAPGFGTFPAGRRLDLSKNWLDPRIDPSRSPGAAPGSRVRAAELACSSLVRPACVRASMRACCTQSRGERSPPWIAAGQHRTRPVALGPSAMDSSVQAQLTELSALEQHPVVVPQNGAEAFQPPEGGPQVALGVLLRNVGPQARSPTVTTPVADVTQPRAATPAGSAG